MPSPLKICLTPQQRQQLQILRDGRERRGWRRAAALLLLDAGVEEGIILDSLGLTRNTLLNWKRRWIAEGIDGLEDRPQSGRPPRVDAAYLTSLVRIVQQDPRDFGFAFTRWTTPRLESYLRQITGIPVSDRWMRELLRRHNFVWRETKRTIRNLQDPVAVAAAEKKLKGLKKRHSAALAESCGSPTASTSPCSP